MAESSIAQVTSPGNASHLSIFERNAGEIQDLMIRIRCLADAIYEAADDLEARSPQQSAALDRIISFSGITKDIALAAGALAEQIEIHDGATQQIGARSTPAKTVGV